MSKIKIFYLDKEDDFSKEINTNFQNTFTEYEFCVHYYTCKLLESIHHSLLKDDKIPIIFIGDQILNQLNKTFFNFIKQELKLTNMILLSSKKQIQSLKNELKDVGFYTYLTKKHLKNNIFLTIHDAIKNYNMNQQINNSYKKDSLTGLYNRNTLIKELRTIQQPLILLVNIDDFRVINTTYGYKMGDMILKMVTKELTKVSSFTVYRLISDEFVILTKNINKIDAHALALKIKTNIQKRDFCIEDEIIKITVSIAISNNQTNLIEDAQETIWKSVKNQKNAISMVPNFIPQKNQFGPKHLRLALATNAIIPYYQGIRSNKTGKIVKYECLVRIKDEQNNIVPPNIFLQLAQDTGLMPRITRVLIEKTLHKMQTIKGHFSINLTESDLKEQYILDFLIQKSNLYKVDLNRLTFEILENINIENSPVILEQIKKLKQLGCKIAFDDFGCEKSNFSRLLDLNIDIVKIDRMFIKNIHKDHKSFKLTRAITNLAKDFDCEVVAEGVESQETQDIIEELGIDYTQGYYYSKPKEDI